LTGDWILGFLILWFFFLPPTILFLIAWRLERKAWKRSYISRTTRWENLSMEKTVLRVMGVLVIGFISAGIGMIVGALIGGNYAEQFVFNGVQGYEATGQLGFIFGALIGLILSWRFLISKRA
jgi:small-conductance mechanosensitive channel